jgi:hypothetical protein
MDNTIIEFFNIMSKNDFEAKYKDIPDEIEDELIEELIEIIEEDGYLPDPLRYFEINNYSSPLDLEEFLEMKFNEFKIALRLNPNKDVVNEIHDQALSIKEKVILIKAEVKPLNDMTLNDLIDLKLKLCEKTIELTGEHEPSDPGKPPKQEPVYYFTINPVVNNSRYGYIEQLHKELENAGYIDCPLRTFRRLFIETGGTIPKDAPEPIIWKKSQYNHLSFFIKCLNGTLLTNPNSPSNYQIALNLFFQQENGRFFTPNKERYDGRVSQKVKDLFESMMKRLDLNKKEIPSRKI